MVTAHLPATGPELGDDLLLATARRGHLMASHGVDAIACRPSAASLLTSSLLIGEGVEQGEVVDVLGAVLVPEIVEAALLAC